MPAIPDPASSGAGDGRDERRATPAGRLGARLAALAVRIERADCTVQGIDLPSYADGPRPSGLVRLSGGGHEGVGEHVAWTFGAQHAFVARLGTLVPPGERTLGALRGELRAGGDPAYERAAIEAAAIDLALRQAGKGLAALAEAEPSPARYVVSLAVGADPLPAVREEMARSPGIELKIDVGPGWSRSSLAGLADLGSVAVLDFKGRGSAADVVRAHASLPAALIEDPPAAALGAATLDDRSGWPISVDAALVDAAALDRLPFRPRAANVKPARMGGVLEALEAVDLCGRRGIAVYFGGMFEVGAGRDQLLALATLLSPEGPNDIAPIPRRDRPAPRPRRLPAPPEGPGFAPR